MDDSRISNGGQEVDIGTGGRDLVACARVMPRNFKPAPGIEVRLWKVVLKIYWNHYVSVSARARACVCV